MPSQMPWKQAIVHVLREEGGPLHYDTIVERISDAQLRSSFGATPSTTVASVISQSLKNDAKSPFERVEPGYIRLAADGSIAAGQKDDDGLDAVGGIVTAFGMYWDRSYVDWEPTKPRLLGQQSKNSDEVDFSDQVGVYLLYDRREIVYVGQSNEERKNSCIGQRLRLHTNNRLRSRWDRFSWFGLNPVGNGAANHLLEIGTAAGQKGASKAVIDVMEAVLIEAIEPRQNRRQGDYFRGLEYLQVEDPQVAKKKLIQALQAP